jgi:PAS domain S-box-containing protein
VPDSLIDLAGLSVNAEDFLAAVLAAAAQPVWVVDPGGVIRFANPAALAALGYDSAEELSGSQSHDAIHHHRPDGAEYPAAECRMLLSRTTGEVVDNDLDWFFRRDGSMFPVSYVSVPLEMHEGRGAVVAFTDIEERRRVEQVLREHDASLATQQACLQRIATLVAEGAASEDVFTGIAKEVAELLGLPIVLISRYELDGMMCVLASWSDRPHRFQTGSRWPLEGSSVSALVQRTGRPARIDDYAGVRGTIGDAVRESGMRAGAAAPIVVDGDVWGSILTGQIDRGLLPDHVEDRLAEFTELVAAAVSNATSRDELALVANEQAALRRVATLVARGVPPNDVFAAVAEEVGRLMPLVEANSMARYEADGTQTIVASWSERGIGFVEVGTQWTLDGESVGSLVHQTGLPARMDSYTDATGPLASLARESGIRSAAGAPIVVDGRLWGVMGATTTQPELLPIRTEFRLAKFTELVATAIANADSRAQLTASRARIVAAADETRRRIERDLHDGAQQRLVTVALELRAVGAAMAPDDELRAQLLEATSHLEGVHAELVEIARGIHPAILSEGGLEPALKSLARRSAVPVELHVRSDRRQSERVEVAAYYVVSEALTNAAKYAQASVVIIDVEATDAIIRLAIRDDGVGGADTAQGSGLIGLRDRVETLGGRIEITSPAGQGTSLLVEVPIEDD